MANDLTAFAFSFVWRPADFFLRYTLYALLATPLPPLIYCLGWVYRDKPMFLTALAAILAAVIWAIVLYLLLGMFRYFFTR